MVVTCPGCQARYRVRNETVPTEGARMRCPKCETLFMAMPPAPTAEPIDAFGALMKRVPASQTPMPAVGVATKPPPPPAELTPAAGAPIPLSLDDLEAAPLELARSPARSPTGRMPVALAEPTAPNRPQPAAPKATAAPSKPTTTSIVRAISVVALLGGTAIAAMGVLTAAWSSETWVLDDAWMPGLERTFEVQPPVSFLPSATATMEAKAVAAERMGDAAAALSWWRGVQAAEPGHVKAGEQVLVWSRLLGEK
jgi:predicted Zn finger-like uncharacterized protein